MSGQSHDVGHLLRALAPRVLGAVTRRSGDFSAAEDAVQEALLAAAVQWPRDGAPRNPGGWLFQVACRRMTDQLRSAQARRRRESSAAAEAEPLEIPGAASEEAMGHDDTLTLLLLCCHPALTPASAIALTLRAVGGLTTAEIASAFLVPEATMAQRISRAKHTIKASGAPFVLPERGERARRIESVLRVLYLIFNEGYTSSSGPSLQRVELAAEAIRLTRALHQRAPEEAEAAGLLALMLLTDARRPARTGPAGELIPLDEQDRSLWRREAIAEGTALVTDALARGSIGAYQLQAAIAALHDEAPGVEETDWPQIELLYRLLLRMSPSPMVTLSHAIATAMVHGPAAGLDALEPLGADPRMSRGHRLDAVRAHLLERAGALAAATACYQSAAAKASNLQERYYLISRAARLAARS